MCSTKLLMVAKPITHLVFMVRGKQNILEAVEQMNREDLLSHVTNQTK